MKKIFDNAISAGKLIFLSGLIRIFFKKKNLKKEVWLINEKIDEARDNGFALFKYVRENHPEIPIYYVITKSSKDLSKIIPFGNVVYYGSIQHFILYLNANVLISSQTLPYPIGRRLSELLSFCRLKDPKKVWLQHGIIKDKLPHSSMDYATFQYDLISCSAAQEKNFIINEYNYPEKNVVNVGLCRFDTLLSDISENVSIIVMPTFRKWLVPNKRIPTKLEIENFKESDFFKKYTQLLNALANQINDVEIIFYMHYGLQPFSECFEQKFGNNPKIIIAKSEDYDVQKLLVSSNLLITDYSSVFFDFAYMKKPEIYFQFDQNEYRKNHYNEGYFSYAKNGFGNVVVDVEDVIVEVKNSLENGMSEIYIERVNNFFSHFDRNNSERTFERIKSLLH
ncbi:CDP-glycerol glycerophosphotransferase family protein [Leuconostoc lactis]|uniref:CDP-glycerol glycerophosphotransferase family protein n=1 Tax=Leuconostoc lactis TaxID=1246 RepID=UPI0025AFE55E|nr:CDP-glycerol glycerophosphotransferase family protein [Leuconostoc lactis]MDN2649370.1 CDP-glycerol glycerophosphotransferase family protein [Leuconostoc lactis]